MPLYYVIASTTAPLSTIRKKSCVYYRICGHNIFPYKMQKIVKRPWDGNPLPPLPLASKNTDGERCYFTFNIIPSNVIRAHLRIRVRDICCQKILRSGIESISFVGRREQPRIFEMFCPCDLREKDGV